MQKSKVKIWLLMVEPSCHPFGVLVYSSCLAMDSLVYILFTDFFYWLHNTLNPLKSYVYLFNSCFEGHSNGYQKSNKTVFPTKDMRISQTTEYSPLRRERPDWGGEVEGRGQRRISLICNAALFEKKNVFP